MSGATHKQLALLLEGVHRLNATQGVAELREVLTEVVVSLVDSDHMCHNELDLELSRFYSAFTEPGLDEEVERVLPIFDTIIRDHPILEYTLNNPDGEVQRLSDHISVPAFRDLPLYQLLYKHVRTERQLILDFGLPERSVVALVLNRERVDYSDDDLMVLRLLQPHLRQAYARCRQREIVDAFLHGRPSDLLFEALIALGLGEREAEVCLWMAQGLSNAEIAEAMRIKPATAKKHAENIYAKLGAAGRTEVVSRILRDLTREQSAT